MNATPPDTPEVLLAELRRRGIELRRSGDRLRYRPREAMTSDLVTKVTASKAGLLALVPDDQHEFCWSTAAHRLVSECADELLRSDLMDHFEETAATLEFDQGLDRQQAEMQAFGQLLFRVLQLGIDARVIP